MKQWLVRQGLGGHMVPMAELNCLFPNTPLEMAPPGAVNLTPPRPEERGRGAERASMQWTLGGIEQGQI